MHTNKLGIWLGVLLSAGMVAVQAQAPPQGAGAPGTAGGSASHIDPEKQAQALGRKLNLTAYQVGQIKPILEDEKQDLDDVLSDTSLPVRDRRSRAQKIRQDTREKLEDVMNDQQKAQFEQMQPQGRGPRGMGGPQQAPPEPQQPQQ